MTPIDLGTLQERVYGALLGCEFVSSHSTPAEVEMAHRSAQHRTNVVMAILQTLNIPRVGDCNEAADDTTRPPTSEDVKSHDSEKRTEDLYSHTDRDGDRLRVDRTFLTCYATDGETVSVRLPRGAEALLMVRALLDATGNAAVLLTAP